MRDRLQVTETQFKLAYLKSNVTGSIHILGLLSLHFSVPTFSVLDPFSDGLSLYVDKDSDYY